MLFGDSGDKLREDTLEFRDSGGSPRIWCFPKDFLGFSILPHNSISGMGLCRCQSSSERHSRFSRLVLPAGGWDGIGSGAGFGMSSSGRQEWLSPGHKSQETLP